ncbi:hypothetical protein JL100_031155 (plasmid) [Skermanella mucosa]|uniref:hypothetical protein n=1 Tax=Skermanella mucosa TaxID=1789672 RepID=UPI00192C0BCD|nr:hypothetical protein [Skermanella mucosa]UEM24667.1 hypothetical protein JL100_031155 [Skermanella mucosa]
MMKRTGQTIGELVARLHGTGMTRRGTAAPGTTKPPASDLLMAYTRRAALGLVVLGAAIGGVCQIGGEARPYQHRQLTTPASAEGSGQAGTLDDVLAEAGGPEPGNPGFAEGLDAPPAGFRASEAEAAGTDASGIGSLVARLDRQARTLAAIDEAAARVGASARLMRAMASLESSLDATAKASTSSATGLYQFIEATWLSKVRSHGRKYGLGHLARHVRGGPLGEPVVDDPLVRERILALRKDARLSAFLAAELTVDNARRLRKLMGRPVTQTEIYLAHVFGVAGTARFLKAAESTPDRVGASMFPKEARANPGLFRMGDQPATLGEIRKRFIAKMSRLDLPDRLAAIDRIAPARDAAADQDDEFDQSEDWRGGMGEQQVAASAIR